MAPSHLSEVPPPDPRWRVVVELKDPSDLHTAMSMCVRIVDLIRHDPGLEASVRPERIEQHRST